MPYVPRKNWEEVYKNQTTLLSVVKDVDDIFLGGGTAIQRFVSSFQARESDDLDFFLPVNDSKLAAQKVVEIKKALVKNNVSIENYVNLSGTHRFVCKLQDSDERIKLELLDCTTTRFCEDFIFSEHYPRIENPYELILYKLKALHDRQDTIKDLFDLYFLFREYQGEPISQKQLFMDLQMKFEASTGYVYSEAHVIQALEAKHRQWDIVLRQINNIHEHDIASAIEVFKESLLTQIKDSTFEHFQLTYEDMANLENSVDVETFFEYIETNIFVNYGYQRYLDEKKAHAETVAKMVNESKCHVDLVPHG
jgi:hypothetical protein